MKESFNLSTWTLRHRALVIYLMVVVSVLGVLAYTHLSQSEDPPFTFKVMVIQTYWPGATARQVQEEVTDRIARKLQETPNLDFLRSNSRPGASQLFFNIKDSTPTQEVAATWYQVRKKVADIAAQLPPGVQGPFFNDEYGDVYTNLYALSGDGFTPAQLHDYAENIRQEVLRVDGIGKIDLIGDQTQHVVIELDPVRMARMGLSAQDIGQTLAQQNAVTPAGRFSTSSDLVYVQVSGQLSSSQDIAQTLLTAHGQSIRLGDIANVRRGYDDPQTQYLRHEGQAALGIGVTLAQGGDVIMLGHALDQRIADISKRLPLGLKLTVMESMPDAVAQSVNEFINAVATAICIVLLISLATLGLRTGMVVVIAIPFVLSATACLMYVFDVGLHKVSLGTLILALGLLVDDAIIAIEMMKVKLEQGWDRMRAAAFAYESTAFPMLTGTLVTIAGFLPIALAKSSTGEYTRSIFQVSAFSLSLSWLAAVTVIPLLGYYLLPKPGETQHAIASLYQTPFYTRLRALLNQCLQHRYLVILATAILFVLSLLAFSSIAQQFFPSSDRSELLVDLSLPENASLAATEKQVLRMEALLKGNPDLLRMSSFVGTGAPRFYLPLDQQFARPNFAQILLGAKDIAARERLADVISQALPRDFPALRGRISRLENGPPVGFPIRFRVRGEDLETVHKIADQVAQTLRKDRRLSNVQLDWDEPSTRNLLLRVDQQKARAAGLSSQDIANFVNMNLNGYTVTQLRDHDKLIAVELRAPRQQPEQLEALSIHTSGGASIALSQIASVAFQQDYGVIWERDRMPTITVQSDTIAGAQAISLGNEWDKQLNALRATLPAGYYIDIGGAVEENGKAQASIIAQMPVMAVVVLTLLMIQLQSVSRVTLVVLTAPLGLIGVVPALWLFGKPFGFVALLGIIAMFGIIMRNSVILLDQIDQDIAAGVQRWDAVVDATVRRFRPIALTAAAAVLALIPLLGGNFFGPMATALMGGITVATVLTLFLLPALYAAWFRVQAHETNTRSSS
jgi:multidrug efflux pump subunit AcrB